MRFETQRKRSRILTSVVTLLFLVGAIPLGLFGLRLTAFNRERLEAQQKEHQLVIAESIARELGEFVRAKQSSVQGFARGLEAAVASGGAVPTMKAILDGSTLNRYLAVDPDLLKIVFAIPAEGAPELARRIQFVEAGRPADPRLYAGAEEELVRTLLDRGLKGEAIVAVPQGPSPLFLMVQPVKRGDEVVAVVAAIVSLKELQSRLEARSQALYVIYLVDAKGERLLAQSRRDEPQEQVLQSDLVASFREAGGTQTMPFVSRGSGGDREMLGAFATVPGTGWGVLLELESDKAFYSVIAMKRTTVAWSIASVLLALLLGTLFARRLVDPIRALAEGAQRLARGDFSRPIQLKSRNELGLLAESFNHMGDEIKDQLEKLEVAASENKELFLASIKMLAEAIDEKDPYTRGHSERVTRFAVATARAYGLGDEEVERVQLGALLHDVGKIGIDDRILRKPSVLTDEEFEIMKQHPDKGAHIMGAVRQLADIVPGMRFHHEKVDGTGYPLGLKGDEIPLAAQIISVADTFDAMTTDRPYQKGMDPDFVVGKLISWIGTRFRKDVVEAFERAFRNGRIELRPRRPAPAPPPPATEAAASS